MRNRYMYYATGLPGWMRFGYSPGWAGRSASGLGPCAEYLMTGRWPFAAQQPPAGAYYPPTGAGQPFPAVAPEAQLSALRAQAQILKSQLDEINNRIEELDKKQTK